MAHWRKADSTLWPDADITIKSSARTSSICHVVRCDTFKSNSSRNLLRNFYGDVYNLWLYAAAAEPARPTAYPRRAYADDN